jgi:hypothetical protein
MMIESTVEDTLHRCGTRFWMAPEVIRQEPQGPGVCYSRQWPRDRLRIGTDALYCGAG